MRVLLVQRGPPSLPAGASAARVSWETGTSSAGSVAHQALGHAAPGHPAAHTNVGRAPFGGDTGGAGANAGGACVPGM